jgi:hypothetical protein
MYEYEIYLVRGHEALLFEGNLSYQEAMEIFIATLCWGKVQGYVLNATTGEVEDDTRW